MIKTKRDLKEYLKADLANNFCLKHSKEIKYIKTLRKTEFHCNCNHFLRSIFWRFKLRRMQNKFLTYIPINIFGPGLSISHLGCIYIGNTASFGKNARISQNITIGSTSGSDKAPVVGDNCFVGPNVCLIGEVNVADDVCIAAGCVVVKDIKEPATTWGGVPARKISDNNSHSNLPLFKKQNN